MLNTNKRLALQTPKCYQLLADVEKHLLEVEGL